MSGFYSGGFGFDIPKIKGGTMKKQDVLMVAVGIILILISMFAGAWFLDMKGLKWAEFPIWATAFLGACTGLGLLIAVLVRNID